LKTIFNILLWCLILIPGYFILNRWVNDGQVDINGFYLLLAAFALLMYQLIGLAEGTKVVQKSLRNNLYLLLAVLLVTLLGTELGLRQFAHSLKSGPEKSGDQFYTTAFHYYIRQCDSCDGRNEYVNGPNTKLDYKTAEFDYMHLYNDYGLRDHEFNVKKDTNEYRILALGDSFVEGVGTTADSSWVKRLEGMLNSKPGPVHYNVMNAGVHGSDLFFSYELLQRCLLKFKPDLVILDLNSTDNGEIVVRGDFERFDSAGNYHNKKGPWWQFAFGSSYMVRLLFLNLLHYNWSLQSPWQYREDQVKGIEKISLKTKDYYRLSKEQNFKFLLVLQPLQNELSDESNFLGRLKTDTAIDKIDLTGGINDTVVAHPPLSQWYWPKDGHFTSLGYGLEAELIYKEYFEKQ
jgi:lysophospholipase L1-like esterase